jgi:site-specific DNA-methyltransferase (adenine-specific)
VKPYYEHAGITIYHGDCRDVLPQLVAKAVVTDPPYGIADAPLPMQGRTGKRTGAVNTWHPASDWDSIIDPLWLTLCAKSAPIVAWFGHWRMRAEVENFSPFPIRAEIVWAKDCHTAPPCPVAPRDERIWIFSENGICGLRFETSVWDEPIIPTWEIKHHKNEKPLALMSRLVSWLNAESVIDPFMGSGTTLVAAKKLGRTAAGIDICEKYCEIAAKRLAQEVLTF